VPLDPSRGSLRLLRAGVFTSVAVLLAAIGHSCAADTSSAALLSLLIAIPPIFAGAWLLAARRRQIPLVLGVSVLVQGGLHLLLSRMSGAASISLDAFWCHSRPLSQLPAGTSLAGWHSHGSGPPWHMLVAHLLAAAVAGVWMARGDRALESLLRLLAAASAVLRVKPLPAATVVAAGATTNGTPPGWQPLWHPRRLQLLRVSVARRGPPAYAC
jgi:hypothetical protein